MTGENSPVVTRSAADFRMMRETLGLSQAWVARTVGVDHADGRALGGSA